MACVVNSKAKFYSSAHSNELSDHYIESEGDKLIKELSRKQLNTNITLDSQLKQKKEFDNGHTYKPITELLNGGITTSTKLKELISKTESPTSTDKHGADHTKNNNIGRHLKELALAVKPNSIETKLLKFAIECSSLGEVKPGITPDDHPINNIVKIDKNRFGYLKDKDDSDPQKLAKTVLRKRRQLLESQSEPVEIKRKPIISNNRTLWDVTEVPKSKISLVNHKQYTCEKPKWYTISDGTIMELNDGITVPNVQISNEKLKQTETQIIKKLSENEIKSIPKFSNYNKGEPSPTLYLKNLTKTLTEEILISMFEEYQEMNKPRITCKLIQKGNMSGQAFINFHCTETASKAMNSINGLVICGKPIIAQFSNKFIGGHKIEHSDNTSA